MIRETFTGLAMLAALQAMPAMADDGHNHGAAPAAAAAPAMPRFATSSELFELVGVIDGQKITVYLDRFTDNAPVKGATLELEIGGVKVALKETAEGEFEGTLAKAPAVGLTPVTATVVAGNDNDLLAADLDVHGEAHTDAHVQGWKEYLGWAVGALVALLALAWVARRVLASRRAGGAA